MLKFELSGPVFEFDKETTMTFKRVSSKQVFQWELENSILVDRSPKEMKQFAERASKGQSNWDFYSGAEKSSLSSLGSRFCIDFCEVVSGIIDENGNEINYQDFSPEQKIRFWDLVQEQPKFIDWLSKYKAGGEKKSPPLVENN